jgi:predicted XRE-type DNA-binding protein
MCLSRLAAGCQRGSPAAEIHKTMQEVREMTAKDQPADDESSGNVFADLGLPNPAQEQLKARLARAIHRRAEGRALTQTHAAKVLGIRQSQVSALMRARPGSFSVGRLIDFLTILGKDVEIAIHGK